MTSLAGKTSWTDSMPPRANSYNMSGPSLARPMDSRGRSNFKSTLHHCRVSICLGLPVVCKVCP